MDTTLLTDACPDLVTWTLFSGKGDPTEPILFDASDPTRWMSRAKATTIVEGLLGAFQPDSTVCLHIPNDVCYPPLVLAILANKCRWTGTNVAYKQNELEHHFRLSNTKYIITGEEHLAVVQTAVKASGITIILFSDLSSVTESSGDSDDHDIPRTDSFLDPQPGSFKTLHDLVKPVSHTTLRDAIKDISPDSIAALSQTSGTTGLPKMAARTHRSMVIEQHTIEDNNAGKPYEVRRLYCTPIFHGFACPEMIFNVLRLGQKSWFMHRFDDSFAQKIFDNAITETFGAPPMLLRLVNKPECYPLLQSLRLISFGGAPLMPELRQRALAIFHTAPRIVPVYGMTEGGWFTTLKHPEVDDTGSLGHAIPGYDIRVLPHDDNNTTALHNGQPVGEILVRGPQLMTGYIDNPAATAATLRAGWLHTGDIGYVRDGKVYLVDRAKDLIKVSGWQVAPAELENALLQSPDVRDVAVLGVGAGVEERPVACVVPARDGVKAEELLGHLRTRLAGYKVSRCEVRFVQVIPRSPAGKVLKRVLREQVLE